MCGKVFNSYIIYVELMGILFEFLCYLNTYFLRIFHCMEKIFYLCLCLLILYLRGKRFNSKKHKRQFIKTFWVFSLCCGFNIDFVNVYKYKVKKTLINL